MKNLSSREISQIWNGRASAFTKHYTDKGDSHRDGILNPEIFRLLGDLQGKKVLEAGCGEGYLSRLMVDAGANVTSVDYSEKMLELAKERSAEFDITYYHSSIEDLSFLEDNTFDFVVSNTVFQDVPDYHLAIREINRVLKKDGVFILTVTHPCFSAPGNEWVKDENGRKLYWKVDNYFQEGLYDSGWADDKNEKGLVYFHRTLSNYYSALTNNNFIVAEISEPKPSKKAILKYPWLISDLRMPQYMIFKSQKIS